MKREILQNFFSRKLIIEDLLWIAFLLFILTFPLQTRILILSNYSYIGNKFIDYNTFSFFATDIVIIVASLAYFVNLLHNKQRKKELIHKLSINLHVFLNFLYHKILKKSNNLTKEYKIFDIAKIRTLSIPLSKNKIDKLSILGYTMLIMFILWSFLSIFWAKYPEFVLYKSFRLVEFGLIFVLAASIVQNYHRFFTILVTLNLAGLFQAIVAVGQYTFQHSLGLKILGESPLNPNLPGVAKIVIDSEKVIRAYGTFSHPNILATFLILTIFSGIIAVFLFNLSQKKQNVSRETFLSTRYPHPREIKFLDFFYKIFSKMFHVKHFEKNGLNKTKIEGNLQNFAHKNGVFLNDLMCRNYNQDPLTPLGKYIPLLPERGLSPSRRLESFLINTLFFIFLIIQIFALFFTFSRINWLVYIILLAAFFLIFQKYKLLELLKYHFLAIFIALVLMIVLFWQPLISRISPNSFEQTLNERLIYQEISYKIINFSPLIGIGNGNFVPQMQEFSQTVLKPWQLQPVHNLYLLITSELGIIGLVLFTLFLVMWLRSVYLNTIYAFLRISSPISLFAEDKIPLSSPFIKEGKGRFLGKIKGFLKQNLFQLPKSYFSRNQFGKMTKNKQKTLENNKYFLSSVTNLLVFRLMALIFVSFLFLGLFDHYFWTSQQGQIIFWLTLGLLAVSNRRRAKNHLLQGKQA